MVGGDSGVAVAVEVEESGSVSPKEVARALSATVNSGPVAAATAGVEEASTRPPLPPALAATITSVAVAVVGGVGEVQKITYRDAVE